MSKIISMTEWEESNYFRRTENEYACDAHMFNIKEFNRVDKVKKDREEHNKKVLRDYKLVKE